MKLSLLWVGKTKNRQLLSLLQEYERRIRRFCELRLIEIKSEEQGNALRVVAREGERLLAKIRTDDFLIALDRRGRDLSSEDFGKLIAEKRNHSLKNLVFLVGGPFGLSEPIRARADQLLSLSRMTLNHEITRLVLLEQVYRAFTLMHGIPYHK